MNAFGPKISIPLSHYDTLVAGKAREAAEYCAEVSRLNDVNYVRTREISALQNKVRGLEAQLAQVQQAAGGSVNSSLDRVKAAVAGVKTAMAVHGSCSWEHQTELDKTRATLKEVYGEPNRIDQIKGLREATGLGLKDAKDFVEKYSDYIGG